MVKLLGSWKEELGKSRQVNPRPQTSASLFSPWMPGATGKFVDKGSEKEGGRGLRFP